MLKHFSVDASWQVTVCSFSSSLDAQGTLLPNAEITTDTGHFLLVVPSEHEEAFRDFMIVLRPQASIHEINTIIYAALQDPQELQRKALAGFAYAREFLTNTRKVDRILRDVEAYKKVSDNMYLLNVADAYSTALGPSRL